MFCCWCPFLHWIMHGYIRAFYILAGACAFVSVVYLTAKPSTLNTLHRFDSSTHKRIHSNRRRFLCKVSFSSTDPSSPPTPPPHPYEYYFFLSTANRRLATASTYSWGASENFTSHPFVVPPSSVYTGCSIFRAVSFSFLLFYFSFSFFFSFLFPVSVAFTSLPLQRFALRSYIWRGFISPFCRRRHHHHHHHHHYAVTPFVMVT